MLSENIRKYRTVRGLSQSDLAEAIGMSSGHVSEIERGAVNPKFSTVQKIAEVLGCSTDQLGNGTLVVNFADKETA